jgi:hypothetical protein
MQSVQQFGPMFSEHLGQPFEIIDRAAFGGTAGLLTVIQAATPVRDVRLEATSLRRRWIRTSSELFSGRRSAESSRRFRI